MSFPFRERSWIPAVVAPTVLVLGLIGLAALDLFTSDDRFLGTDLFSGTFSGGRVLNGTVVGIAVLLVLGAVGTWAALRERRPGSAAFPALPAFLSTWMVLVVATLVAAGVSQAVDLRDVGGVEQSVLTGGAMSGLRVGWVAALVSTAVWLAVRPRVEVLSDPPSDDGPDAEPELVIKRFSDLNLEAGRTARLNAETVGRRESDGPEAAPEPTYVGRRSSGQYAEDDEESPESTGTSGSHRG